MAIGDNDCYGNKKYEIIKTFFIAPIAHVKMLPHMKKMGCCGPLEAEFIIFSYTGIKDRSDRGTFVVGRDCAGQIVDAINTIKAKAGKPPLDMPPLFDISVDGGFVGGYKGGIKVLNHDVLTLLLLLASVWDVKKFYGAPANILERIAKNPLRTIGRYDLLKVKDIISRVDIFNAIREHEKDGHTIGKFKIPYFNTVLDFIETELERSSSKEAGKNSR